MNWIKKITVGKAVRWSAYVVGAFVLIIVLVILAHNSFSHSEGWIYAVRVWAHQGYFSSQPGDGVWGKDHYATTVWLVGFWTVGFWVVFGIIGAIWEATKRQVKYRRKLAKIRQ